MKSLRKQCEIKALKCNSVLFSSQRRATLKCARIYGECDQCSENGVGRRLFIIYAFVHGYILYEALVIRLCSFVAVLSVCRAQARGGRISRPAFVCGRTGSCRYQQLSLCHMGADMPGWTAIGDTQPPGSRPAVVSTVDGVGRHPINCANDGCRLGVRWLPGGGTPWVLARASGRVGGAEAGLLRRPLLAGTSEQWWARGAL